ncbi:MAG TPA: hypothetical protein VH988_23665 [Thermoanaerobaculia bacterium]|jgi:hypothetical protein|nr:hypothetical protein [Thermoanaerobaculia bacterium]
MTDHLELLDIARLLTDDPSACRHLAALCPVCGERLRRVEALMQRFHHWNAEVMVLEGLEADELLAGFLAAGHDSATWSSRVEQSDNLQTWGVAWAALERARQLLADPDAQIQARDLALLAAAIAGHLGDFYHPDWVADLKALASATAAASNTPGADAVGARPKQVAAAVTALEQGTGDDAVAKDVWSLLERAIRGSGR